MRNTSAEVTGKSPLGQEGQGRSGTKENHQQSTPQFFFIEYLFYYPPSFWYLSEQRRKKNREEEIFKNDLSDVYKRVMKFGVCSRNSRYIICG